MLQDLDEEQNQEVAFGAAYLSGNLSYMCPKQGLFCVVYRTRSYRSLARSLVTVILKDECFSATLEPENRSFIKQTALGADPNTKIENRGRRPWLRLFLKPTEKNNYRGWMDAFINPRWPLCVIS